MRIIILLSCLLASMAAESASFFNHHVLLFFFASSCPHCHHQAPILKNWANQNGITVDARTLDDKLLPEFPNATTATAALVETAFRGNPIRYPALFVMNPSSGALYPVAIGSMTRDELDMRMQALVPKIIAYEQGGHS